MGINGVKYANTIYAAKDGPLDAKSLAPNYESLKSESYWGDLANGKPYIKNGEVFSTEDSRMFILRDKEKYNTDDGWEEIITDSNRSNISTKTVIKEINITSSDKIDEFIEGFYLAARVLNNTAIITEYTGRRLFYSNPFEVKKGDVITVRSQGTSIGVLCTTGPNINDEDNVLIAKLIGNKDYGIQEQSYIVEEDGYVTYSSRFVEGCGISIYRGETIYGYKIINKLNPLSEQLIYPNTIYEIRYNHNENIKVPVNSVLKFTGGTLSNCTIVGNNVTIDAPLVQIFGDNVTFSGDFNCNFYPEWFGATSVIDENTDNSEAFNKAIKAINSMNGAHNLMLTTHYVLKDTIYLYPKVSLIGTYGTDDYTTATPKNEAIGCGFIANFSNNDKYVIDSDFAKDYKNKIAYTDMWIDYTNIKTDSTFTHRKQTNIRDITIQPYKKSDGSYNVPFGGIRLIDAYYGYIENVHISGVAVGISLHNSWKYHISKVYLTVCFCGFYFGIHNTTQYLSSCKIYGSTDFQWVSNDGTIKTTDDRFSDKFNWRPKALDEDNRCNRAAIFPPYDINGNRPAFSNNTADFGYYPADEKYSNEPIDLKLIGFISETYRTLSINKIKFQTVVFHWLNCIGLDDNGEMDFDFCYVESKSDTPALQFKTGLYTYRGRMTWNNPARTEKIRPYGLATMWGTIKSDRMYDGTCFPYRQAATFTNEGGVKTNKKYIYDDPSYILANTEQYLDKYNITEDKTTIEYKIEDETIVEDKTIRITNSGVGANKQYIGQQTFYVGYVDYKVTNLDYYYQDVASGLVYHAPTSFKNILERYDPDNAVFVQSLFNTDFSAGGKLLINKNFKFRRGTSNRIATDHRFALLQPMRLHDSCIEIGYDGDTSFSLDKDLKLVSIDGIPNTTRTIPPVFAVSGKCTIKINNWFNFSTIKDSITPKGFIKIVDDDKDYSNSPIEVHLICPSLYESNLSHESIIENTEPITTKYRIIVTNYKDTVILTNTTPPTKGVDIGETFIYNGENLIWDGTDWKKNNINNTETVNKYNSLKYLENTGTQYIDTGLILSENDIITLDFEVPDSAAALSTDKIIIDARDDTNGLRVSTWGDNKKWYARFGHNAGTTSTAQSEVIRKGSLIFSKDSLIVNGVTVISSMPFTAMPNSTLKLFSGVTTDGAISAPSHARISSCKITRDGETIMNLLPVQRSEDGVLGMRDIISDNFFINAGTGIFNYELAPVAGEATVKKYPSLTDEQKAAIQSLMDDYYNNRSVFYYEFTHNRNAFVSGSTCYDSTRGKFKQCCATFVQHIMMGRSINDFLGKNASTYSSKITKTDVSEFGYYFDFKYRKYLYGLTDTDENGNTKYYGYVQPNADNFEGSYSYNSYYHPDSTKDKKQNFNGFVNANDMARELYEMGCEIPFSELEVGDIIFTLDNDLNDNSSMFNFAAWRNIYHVGMVYDVKQIDASSKEIYYIECTSYFDTETRPIEKPYLSSSQMDLRFKAFKLTEDMAFCARMPIVFGYESNVPDNITNTPTA